MLSAPVETLGYTYISPFRVTSSIAVNLCPCIVVSITGHKRQSITCKYHPMYQLGGVGLLPLRAHLPWCFFLPLRHLFDLGHPPSTFHRHKLLLSLLDQQCSNLLGCLFRSSAWRVQLFSLLVRIWITTTIHTGFISVP